MLAFIRIPISSEPTTSAKLIPTIYTIIDHKHGQIALSDPGIYGNEHRDMPQFDSAGFLPLQTSVSLVSFPVNNMHSSADVLTPPSSVPLQTISSNITNNSFANGQAEFLPVPMIPAQTGKGFVSLSSVFAGGEFSSSGVNQPPIFLSASHFNAPPVQRKYSVPFGTHTVSHYINNYYTNDAIFMAIASCNSNRHDCSM